jgi:hypothetical protein
MTGSGANMSIRRILGLGVVLSLISGCGGEGYDDDSLSADAQESELVKDAALAGAKSVTGTTAVGGFKIIKPPTVPPGVLEVVRYADLKLDGTMRFYGWESPVNGNVSAQIDVTNIGNAPATGASGRIYAANVVRPTALYQYWGGTATAANTVNPGERGYLLVQIPISFIKQCQSYTVELDLDHTMQYERGYTGVFNNDLGQARTQCLTWDSPITTELLGHVPDPLLQGKRLSEIVGSFVQGSPAGLCSSCHHIDAPTRRYSPSVAQGSGSNIRKTDVIDGQSWAFAGGWVDDFAAVPWKPADLKLAFQMWVANGSP